MSAVVDSRPLAARWPQITWQLHEHDNLGHALSRVRCGPRTSRSGTPAFAISVILPIFIRYALERGTEHVAFVYDGMLLLNVSLAAFPDAKMWQVWDVRVRGWCAAQKSDGQDIG